jgi:L-alanine-DL-glutamate epimerase-like enolase superfamily enzyme
MQVQIHYDGITGYGEAAMPPYYPETPESAAKFYAKLDLAQFNDPFQIEKILDYVDHVEEGNHFAKASIDIALHDLVGKLMNQPWYRIWGYDKEKAPSTSFTIGIDKPDVVREKTEEAAPYNVLKIKLGGDNDKEMIENVRAVAPKKELYVDVNGGWKDKHQALDMAHWLKEQGVVFIEQPMPKAQIDDIAWLTQNSPLPIIADESIQRIPEVLAAHEVYSGINIKLMKCTGMREAHKMLNLARSLDMKVLMGCMTATSCSISAAAQLSPAIDWADLDGNLLISNDPYEGVKVVKGKLVLPDRPGIGIKKL